MPEKTIENNQVLLTGKIASAFVYSHESFGKAFYQTTLMVERFSGYKDFISIILSEDFIDLAQDSTDRFVTIHGQFRSYNSFQNGRCHLHLYVFAQDIYWIAEKEAIYENKIYLDGYLCKSPVYRLTPREREIADFLLAVNRPYGKSDYIPGICWNENAQEMSSSPVGTHVTLSGRIQSRQYIKKQADGQITKKTAYEVSVNQLNKYNEVTICTT